MELRGRAFNENSALAALDITAVELGTPNPWQKHCKEGLEKGSAFHTEAGENWNA